MNLTKLAFQAAEFTGIFLKEVPPVQSPRRYEGENEAFKIDYDAGAERGEIVSIYRKNTLKTINNDFYIEEILSVAESEQFPELDKLTVFVNDSKAFSERYSNLLKESIKVTNPFLYTLAEASQQEINGILTMPYKNDEEIIKAIKTFVSL